MMTQQLNLPIRTQQGIALIMVLLVVALVTIIATGIAAEQKLSTRRTENLLNNEQAYMYLLGAEDWAKDILVRDLQDNNTDTLGDNWATRLPPIPVDGGTIQGSIIDLQARFNINSLVDNAGKPVPASISYFKNLINEINSQQNRVDIPADMNQAMVDWLDKDQDATPPNGAEDGEYLNRRIPYVAANQAMASASEIIKVNGGTYNIYSELAPYIIALPDLSATLNINTAGAMQLSSLSSQISYEQAKDIVKERSKEGYKTVAEFLDVPGIKNKNVDKKLIAVTSNFFLLSARSIIGNSRAELYSVIYRNKVANDKIEVKVLLRSQRRI